MSLKDDPACAAIIKPIVRGEDLRPWYQENEGRWLICLPSGWTRDTFPGPAQTEAQVWEKFKALHPGLAMYLQPFNEAARKRLDKGQFWWELRPCDYYNAFEKPKIFWPDMARFPRFSYDQEGRFSNDKGFFLLTTDISLLGILNSRVCWFCISRICVPLAERLGLIIYQQKIQYMTHLPIPPLTDTQRTHIGNLAKHLTETAKQRYDIRCETTHRIVTDLGTPQAKLNQKLETWWELSFKEFREELVKVFKCDIPLKDRSDWEGFLWECSAEIARLTTEIVRLETELNPAVYAVFGLNEEEIALIERETKYQYGEW